MTQDWVPGVMLNLVQDDTGLGLCVVALCPVGYLSQIEKHLALMGEVFDRLEFFIGLGFS